MQWSARPGPRQRARCSGARAVRQSSGTLARAYRLTGPRASRRTTATSSGCWASVRRARGAPRLSTVGAADTQYGSSVWRHVVPRGRQREPDRFRRRAEPVRANLRRYFGSDGCRRTRRPRHRLRWTARGRDRAGDGVGSRSRTSCTHPPSRNGLPASLIKRAGPDVGDSSMDELDLKDSVALAFLAGAGPRRARSAARRRHVLVAPSAPLVRPGLGRSRGRVKTRHARAVFYNMTNRMATAVEMMPNAEYHAANR